ncbi:MAG: HupE/UreJ family protein, partial [Acidobacteriota bacterium]
FTFGLLHGLGFAGVLTELGLPRGQFVPALLSFNVGVEFGQLTVLLAAFVAVGAWAGSKPWYRARVTVPASLAIAAIGLFWAVQRVL